MAILSPRGGRRIPKSTPVAIALVFAFCLAAAANTRPAPFTSNGTQPPVDFPILGSGECTTCHASYDTSNNIEPWDTWAGSMMAQAARDPLFWAALDVANADVPGIGDWCLRCHAPGPWLAGRSENGNDTNGCGLQGNLDAAGGDFDGVTCHACHRMMINPTPPQGQQGFYLQNADFWIDDGNCNGQGEPCRRGPYDYVTEGGVPPAPDEHFWAYSPYHESSDICGNCHNVTSPAKELLDIDGSNTGLMYPIERTYKEWKNSSYGAAQGGTTCQGCHMPDATVQPAYACYLGENDHTGDLPIHQFAGGNTWIPQVLKNAYGALDLDAAFDATTNFAMVLLTGAAMVEVTADDVVTDGQISASVKVTNLCGHKLPTGYGEGRRMWLQVTARDGPGTVIFESGAYDAATGVLTEDPQATVYEVKQGIWDDNAKECTTKDANGVPHFHFVLNDCVAKDNRIPPLGFTGGNDLETRPIPIGYYPETTPGSGTLVNFDVRDYTIPIPQNTVGPVTVTAALYYQTASKEYVEFLKEQAVSRNFADDCIPRSTGMIGKSRGEYMHDLWMANQKGPPVLMTAGEDHSDIGIPDPATSTTSGDPTVLRLYAKSSPGDGVQRVAYELPVSAHVRLRVFNVAGRAVDTLVDEAHGPGTYFASWNASQEASGVYFFRLEAGPQAIVRRIVVIR